MVSLALALVREHRPERAAALRLRDGAVHRLCGLHEDGRDNVAPAVDRHPRPLLPPRIEVKGKGEVEMFFLEQLKAESSGNDAGTVGNGTFRAFRESLRVAVSA